MKKIFLILAIISLTFSSPMAMSASHPIKHRYPVRHKYKDMPVAIKYWSGFYLGINAGYGGGSQKINNSGDAANVQAAINAGVVPGSMSGYPSGPLGGAQLGYNFRANIKTVLGLETDIQWTNIKSNQTSTNGPSGPFVVNQVTSEQKINYLGTVRARVGYLANEATLLYLTGGYAYGGTKLSTNIRAPETTCVNFCNGNSVTKTSSGWTAGLGMEYGFSDYWSTKLEYLYYDLGGLSNTVSDPVRSPGAILYQNVTFKGSLIRVGLNYNFV